MKRFALFFLTMIMLTLTLSPVLSEGFDSFQQMIDSLSSDADSWQNGGTWTVTYTTTTTTYDGSGNVQSTTTQSSTQDFSAGDLVNMMDWIQDQVNTVAVDNTPEQAAQIQETYDPAVFQTAQPAASESEYETYSQDVYQTAWPAESKQRISDQDVHQIARPAQSEHEVYSQDVYRTAQPAVTDVDVYKPAQEPSQDNESVWNPSWQTETSSSDTAPSTFPSSASSVSTPTVSTGDYTTNNSSVQEQKLLNLINEDRAKNGLDPLEIDPELSRLAQLKADDMNSNNYFAHVSPTYGNASQMLDSFNYSYQGVGENIAHHSNVEKAEAAFMSSDGHRQNILGSQWNKVGLGISVDANGYVYVTQLFAR